MISWLILICTLAFVFLLYLLNAFKYWHRKGVKTWHTHALFGNWSQLKTLHHTAILQELYDRFKSTESLVGFYVYTKPVAVILDLDLAKSVLIADFSKFGDRITYNNHKDYMAANLLFLKSSKWRPLRNKLTSAFTAVKMKYMFPTVKAVSAQLKVTIDKYLKTDNILNVSDLSAGFTTDCVATCIFGIECNSLEDPQNECRQIVAKATGTTNFNIRWHLLKQTYVHVIQMMGIHVKMFPNCIEDFFMRLLKQHFMEREKFNIRRNDLVDLLIDLRKTTDEEGNAGITYNEIAAQLFIFFVGGYEPSAAAIGYALYELARHPHIQEKVRQQIRNKLKHNNNEFTYEVAMGLPYLEQIISEILRLYPILNYLERAATEDYNVPNTNIVLEKGTTVFIPVRSIHYDPEIYEQPEEFRPERFHPFEVQKRHPQSFLGFGDGPRNCIGQRLGSMLVTVALALMISEYRFLVCDKTVASFEYSKHTFAIRSLNDIYLKVEKLKEI